MAEQGDAQANQTQPETTKVAKPDVIKEGQQSPKGVERPPLVTTQQETPPPTQDAKKS